MVPIHPMVIDTELELAEGHPFYFSTTFKTSKAMGGGGFWIRKIIRELGYFHEMVLYWNVSFQVKNGQVFNLVHALSLSLARLLSLSLFRSDHSAVEPRNFSVENICQNWSNSEIFWLWGDSIFWWWYSCWKCSVQLYIGHLLLCASLEGLKAPNEISASLYLALYTY